MVDYKKPRKNKEYNIYNIDKTPWLIDEYWQRIDRKVKTVIINSKPLTKRDKVKYKCIRCGKDVEVYTDKFVKRNGEKYCRECAITVNHERNPNWLTVSKEERQKISNRNSGEKIREKQRKICPVCGNKFEVRLTSKEKNKIYCSRECSIKNWSLVGAKNKEYGKLGPANVSYPSIPEKLFEEWLIKNKYNYSKQVNLFGKTFDFKLSDCLIEVDGNYWHKSKECKINRVKQLKKIVYDKEKELECNNKGIPLYRIWESQIKDGDFSLEKSNRSFEWTEKILDREWLLTLEKSDLITVSNLLLKWVRLYFPDFYIKYDEKNILGVLSEVRGDKSKPRNKYWDNPHTSLIGGNNFLKNRFLSYWMGKKGNRKSIYNAYYDDEILKKVINYRVGINKKRETFDISMKNIIRGFISGGYAISWFSPSLAYEIYKKIYPNAKSLFDPCSGFGARALGFKALGGEYYIGVEYNELTAIENNKLLKELELNGKVYNNRAEKFTPIEKFDLAFTCPPYFNKEKYSKDMIKYNDIKQDFLIPMINTMISKANKAAILVDYNLSKMIEEEYPIIDKITISNRKSHFGNYKNSEYLIILR